MRTDGSNGSRSGGCASNTGLKGRKTDSVVLWSRNVALKEQASPSQTRLQPIPAMASASNPGGMVFFPQQVDGSSPIKQMDNASWNEDSGLSSSVFALQSYQELRERSSQIFWTSGIPSCSPIS